MQTRNENSPVSLGLLFLRAHMRLYLYGFSPHLDNLHPTAFSGTYASGIKMSFPKAFRSSSIRWARGASRKGITS